MKTIVVFAILGLLIGTIAITTADVSFRIEKKDNNITLISGNFSSIQDTEQFFGIIGMEEVDSLNIEIVKESKNTFLDNQKSDNQNTALSSFRTEPTQKEVKIIFVIVVITGVLLSLYVYNDMREKT